LRTMRKACLLLLLVALVLAQDDPCEEIRVRCVGEGESCENQVGCGTGESEDCLLCDETVCVNNECVAGADKGEACSANGPVCGHDRIYTLAVLCVNDRCGTSGTPLYAGDSCSTDDPLIQGADASGGCTSTTCEAGTCKSLDAGADCTLTGLPCPQGEFCSLIEDPTTNGTCIERKASGASCLSSAACQPNLNCMGTSDTSEKTCTPIFSVASGSYCDGTFIQQVGENGIFASTVCNKGLACIDKECADPDDVTGDDCDTDADCDGGSPRYSCVNNPCTDESKCVPLFVRSDETLADDYQAYVNCLNTNDCASTVPWNSGSGGGSNCADTCLGTWTTWREDIPFVFGQCGAAAGLVPAALLATVAIVLALL
jgi:hypothetical protein